MVEISIYLRLGFPGSCLSVEGHPGLCERTIPAVVPTDIAKVENTVDSQTVPSEAPFRNLPTCHPGYLCVFSSHKPHRLTKRS